jgi:hypothetical protein
VSADRLYEFGQIILWQIAEKEADHMLAHHPLAQARTILWRARGQQRRAAVRAAAD